MREMTGSEDSDTAHITGTKYIHNSSSRIINRKPVELTNQNASQNHPYALNETLPVINWQNSTISYRLPEPPTTTNQGIPFLLAP